MRTPRTRRSPARYPLTPQTIGPLRYTLGERDGALVQEFRDYYDLLESAQSGACDMPHRSSRKTQAVSFNDADTFDQALERARRGWPENTRRLRELAASITDDVMQRVPVTEFRRSEEDGVGVDLDSYLQGEPDFLLRHVEVTPPGHESIRIVLNACVSSSVEPAVLQAKGAAVVALASALEKAGRRVEVVVAAAIDANFANGHLETYFPAKLGGEPIQLDQLGFSVASGDVFRRMIFAAWETLPAKVRSDFGIFPKGGYGRVSELRHHANANIVIGSGMRIAWTDAQAARAWVLNQLEAQGVQLLATT